MRKHRVAGLVLLVVLLLGSSETQAARRMGCPHSAAREVQSFTSDTPRTPLSRNITRAGWGFATADIREVPGLIEETNGLDYNQMQKTHVVVYESQERSRGGSFWMHEFNRGSLLHARDNLRREGVDNLTDLQQDAQARSFMLVNVKTTDVRYDDLLWTNTILATSRNLPTTANPQRLVAVNEQFLASLGAADGMRIEDALFVTTARDRGEDLVTVYSGSRSKPGRWMGILLNATRHPNDTKAYIARQLDRMPVGAKVYVIGDAVGLDIVRLADQKRVDVIRRSGEMIKDLVTTHERVMELTARPLERETTVFVNGVPDSVESLGAIGMPTAGVEHWRTLKNTADSIMAGHHARRLTTAEAFMKELTSGENDAVVVVAHADGAHIYIGGERVDFRDLDSLATRMDRVRTRRAILLSCNTANLTAEQRRLFRSRIDTLATILLRKNLFDDVIAPDHTISAPETLAVLRALIAGESLDVVRRTYPGWIRSASLAVGGSHA